MLSKKLSLTVLTFIAGVAVMTAAQVGRNALGNRNLTSVSAVSQVKLSDSEIKDLYYMREEEKLARDVYMAMYRKWNHNIFLNISRSEEQHVASVKGLLSYYGLKDMSPDLPEGKFQNAELQKLYNELIKKGNESLENALTVGATIEDLDIYDLQEAKKKTDKPEIINVYNNLEKGSRNHLRSFYRNLRKYDWNYVPQYIDAEYFKNIISTGNERGRI